MTAMLSTDTAVLVFGQTTSPVTLTSPAPPMTIAPAGVFSAISPTPAAVGGIATPQTRALRGRTHNPYATTPSMTMTPTPSFIADDLAVTPTNLSMAMMPGSAITPMATPLPGPPGSLFHGGMTPVPMPALAPSVVPVPALMGAAPAVSLVQGGGILSSPTGPGPLGMPTGSPSQQGPSALAEVMARQGELASLARCGNGSSFLQSAVREDAQCAQLVWRELLPEMGALLLDPHGGYVVKSLLERVPAEDAKAFVESVAANDALAFSLCTHSLHTRRIIQMIMEGVDCNFMAGILTTRCEEVAKTQQGCIVLQRAMDFSKGKAREALFTAVRANIAVFARDPFANYVVQYYLDALPREETVPAVWAAIQGKVLPLSCDKFASNVLEKFLFVADATSQHALIEELYSSGEEALSRLMLDSYGNYIIQASIARATFADVVFINDKLRRVLDSVPYGSKIITRLDRRLRDRGADAHTRSAPLERPGGMGNGGGGFHHHHQGGNSNGHMNGNGPQQHNAQHHGGAAPASMHHHHNPHPHHHHNHHQSQQQQQPMHSGSGAPFGHGGNNGPRGGGRGMGGGFPHRGQHNGASSANSHAPRGGPHGGPRSHNNPHHHHHHGGVTVLGHGPAAGSATVVGAMPPIPAGEMPWATSGSQ